MRAWLALVTKGAEFEERTIALASDRDRAARRKVSPTGRVPVLHHGTLVIPDSLAILEYLEEALPPPRFPALWPSDPAERARSRWLAAAMHSGFAVIREHFSFNLCFLSERPPAHPAAMAESQEVLALWEAQLTREGRPDGPFLCGTWSGADIQFAPMVVRLRAFEVPTDRFPASRRWMDAVLAHPGVARWLDEARKLPPSEE